MHNEKPLPLVACKHNFLAQQDVKHENCKRGCQNTTVPWHQAQQTSQILTLYLNGRQSEPYTVYYMFTVFSNVKGIVQ